MYYFLFFSIVICKSFGQFNGFGIKLINGFSYLEQKDKYGIKINNYSDPAFNYGFGINYSKKLSNKTGLRIDLMMVKRGWAINISNYFTVDKVYAFRTIYGLSLAPVFAYDLTEFTRKRKIKYQFGIEGGGFISYSPFQYFKYAHYDRVAIKEGTNKFDYGLVFGFYFKRKKKKSNPLSLNLRYYKGLLQVAFTPNPQYNMHIFEA